MFPYETHDGFPNRCPGNTCGVKLKRNWAVGVMPQVFNQVTVVFRCRECGLVFGFMMSSGMVREYVGSLELDEKCGRFDDVFSRKPMAVSEGSALANILRESPLSIITKFRRIEELSEDYGEERYEEED